MWLWMWTLPGFLIGMLIGIWRMIRAVHRRLTGPVARARRLAGGTTPIADREIVTVEGTVRATATALTAPLSGRSCVAYHAIATVPREGRTVRDTIDEHRLTPFELEIAGDGATVTIDGDRAELAEEPRPLIPRKLELEQRFIARHGHSEQRARYSGFAEAVIAVGDRIRVQGLALAEADDDAAQLYRDGAPRIRIIAHPTHPLTIGRR